MYIHTYIHAYIQTYIHTYIQIYTYLYIHVYLRWRTSSGVRHACTHMYTDVNVHEIQECFLA